MGPEDEDSPNHILQHNHIRAMLANELFSDDYKQRLLSLMQTAFVESHQAASEILDRYNDNRESFVLFLRGFQLEAYDWVTEAERDEDRVQATWLSGPVPLELPVAEQIAPVAPVIALANPSYLGASGHVPRLALPSSDWKETIGALIHAAELVIVSLENLAAGVVAELSLFCERAKQSSTIIVLPPREGGSRGPDRVLFRIQGVDIPEPIGVSRERLHLSGFPLVFHEDELDLADLAGTPGFAPIMRELQWASKLSAEDREKRWRAAALNAEGLALLAQREFDQAEARLTAALKLRVELAAEAALVTSLFNLAVLYMDKGDYKEAAACLREVIHRAHLIGEPSMAGIALSYLGEAYRSVGDIGRAVDNFRDGLTLLEQTGSAQDQLNTVTKLCLIFAEAGDMDEGRRYLARAEELQAALAADPFAPQAPAE